MVKSYQGVQKPPEKKLPMLRVRDYMSKKLVTFLPTQSMEEVIAILLRKGVSGGPVVDEQNNLIGMLSEGDCLKHMVKGKMTNSPNIPCTVEEHMIRDVKTVDPELNIFDVAQLFLQLRKRRFPVMENGKLVGQISQRDVMRAVQGLKTETW